MDKLLYINGEWTGSELEKINITNPASGEIVGTVPNGGATETKQAIEAAHQAYLKWSKLTAYERCDLLERYYDLVLENEDELARVLTLEMGKPLHEAKGEIKYAASFLKWFAEEGKRVYGRTVPSQHGDKRLQVIKKAVGVVGAITPWNFPAAMITRKLGPALASGCSIVIKPAKQTPLTAVFLVELAEKAGIPKGVVNLVTGNASKIGDELLSNPLVKKITFTGSTEIGRVLMEKGAKHIKNLSLELGGHAPIIVLDDADLDLAVKGTMASKFRNAGQTCICGNRIYVQENIYEEFITRFVEEASKLKVGNGLDEGTDIGPIIDKNGYQKVEEHVQDALSKGATCVLGGEGTPKNGAYFYPPTVLKDVNSTMLVMHEETFGPVAPIQKFTTDEDAVELANQSPYGLAAYVFSESNRRGTKVVEALDYGIIGWNDGAPSTAQAPFGGMKESGMGREGGIEGLEEYLETKYVSIGV
ncbi:NAD-dependent succinate-semialdehyde dehydrogenase [Bacillus sp. 31A1R]|uniref:NAD-dependent succinate-semialdehyde dehydrogenase n=1 Tax=Robertmurraya mangrovi TaxID=3098077 RepID=A0ABU5IYP6_9BACI|nr:NAD-dependent succinate-semialdehyde dehydrogenase [Bacillus sp. 31A1R]MDZ5472262.1 NAD-dependent succinate-semialdehyde dehydrogenase [Bacillus sp. 31A1R]